MGEITEHFLCDHQRADYDMRKAANGRLFDLSKKVILFPKKKNGRVKLHNQTKQLKIGEKKGKKK